MNGRQHNTHQSAAIDELAAPIAKPRLIQWTQRSGWWRLRGAGFTGLLLQLTATTRDRPGEAHDHLRVS
jgi:hypothetical protein